MTALAYTLLDALNSHSSHKTFRPYAADTSPVCVNGHSIF